MSLISKPYTFSAGTTIIASEHNSNADTIYSDYDGNITNANISGSAAIAYSKLSLTNSVLNADINSSAAIVASKLDLTSPNGIGTTAPAAGKFTTLEATSTLKLGTTNQGDILYDNGTSLIRLTPGTSGQVLQTQGAAANPQWATNAILSNCLFQYAGQVDQQGSALGEVIGTTLNPNNATGNYRFLQAADGSGNYVVIWTAKFIKISGISTVTVWGRIWVRTGAVTANLKVDIGGANGNVTGTSAQTTPEWKSFTIDVSGLSNGTSYDVTASLKCTASPGQVYCSNIMGFGS